LLSIGINTSKAKQELNLLKLGPRKRRRILRGAGRKVRRDSKTRIRSQKDLVGSHWQARSNGRKKRMLTKLGKHMQVHSNPNNAQVVFGNNNIGKIARVHQEGLSQEMTASEAARKYGTPDYKGSATRAQAVSLKEEGYKIRRNKGKGWKNPSIKWIMQNLERGQAGKILRIMRDEPNSKNKWTIALPERSFLGQNRGELVALKNYMLDEAFRLAA